MDVEKLSTLADWLGKGAPGVAFCFGAWRNTVYQTLGPQGDPIDDRIIIKQCAEKDLSTVDLVCGLEGSTVHLFDPCFPIQGMNEYETEWVERRAHEILDLPYVSKDFPALNLHRVKAHDLFNSMLAPVDCTPAQAAVAVRRVIEGLDPWAQTIDV